jgi:HSP20 family protein
MTTRKPFTSNLITWVNPPPSLTTSDYEWYYTPTLLPEKIETEFNDFFNLFWMKKDSPVMCDESSLPKTNIFEDDSGMTIQCLIPFASKEDIQVSLDPIVNSIKVEVEKHQDDDKKYWRKEISRTSFKRSFALDKRFDIGKSQAEYKDSVLTIQVPLNKENEKKQLTIK